MRRLSLPLALLICLLAAAPASAARARASVVGGSDVPITDRPYQVVVFEDPSDIYDSFFCGGVVLDATHVATAAHCVYDEGAGQASELGDLHVLAGSASLDPLDASAVTSDVTKASFDPAYDDVGLDGDIGVLTLATPLYTGTPGSTDPIQPVTLAANRPNAGAGVTVSGWGYPVAISDSDEPDESLYPHDLKAAGLTTAAQTDCDVYGPSTTTLCVAGSTTKDACYGDSGGPLTLNGGNVLVALVEAGNGCAQGNPGIYSRTDGASDTGAYVASPDHPDGPRASAPPRIFGTARPGHTIACAPGTWSSSPTYEYFFANTDDNEQLNASSASATYTVQSSDVGTDIYCEVEARNGGGFGFADSENELTVTAAATTPTKPVTPTTPTKPTTPVVVPSTTVKDVKAPKAAVFSKRCTATRCTLNVIVTDPKPSRGLKRLDAALRRRVAYRCRRHGKRATCHRTATRLIKTKPIGAGHYLVVVPRLKPAKYTLSLRAVDKAGHRQKTVTKVTLRGHKPKKKKKAARRG